jgi:hypothetical protein
VNLGQTRCGSASQSLACVLARTAATAWPRRARCSSRQKGAGRIRAGQALRGSSEFHAWGDSNLYLRRLGNELTLTVEHRAAPSPPAVSLELTQQGEALALEVRAPSVSEAPVPTSVDDRILNALRNSNRPLSTAQLRAQCPARKATLYARLTQLTATGRLVRCAEGYRLAPNNPVQTSS